MISVSAVVLAGGAARRLGGASKPDLIVGGSTLLDLALGACATTGARPVVVVGPPHLAGDGVIVTREDPPGGGPVAGLEAGLAALVGAITFAPGNDAWLGGNTPPGVADPTTTVVDVTTQDADALVLVLACDMPRAADAVSELIEVASSRDSDGAWVVDATGRPQPLLAVYRRRALIRAVQALPIAEGISMRDLTAELDMTPVPGLHHASDDVDTWQDADRWGARPWPSSLGEE